MRALYRPHPTHLWIDQRIQALPLSQKRVLDYCWTGPDVNGIGVTKVEPLVWQARIGEIGVAIITCLEMLDSLGYVFFDKGKMEVFVLDWFRFHQFKTKPAQSAYAKGMRETDSETLKKVATERCRLAGHKLKSVDKSNDSLNNQSDNPPTPTPTSTSTSTSTSTKPPPPTLVGGETQKSGGGLQNGEKKTPQAVAAAGGAVDERDRDRDSDQGPILAFLEALGKPAGTEPIMLGGKRHQDLRNALAGADAEQATLAGQCAAAVIAGGKAKDPIAYSLTLAKKAAQGAVSLPAAVAEKAANDALAEAWQVLAGRSFKYPSGNVARVPPANARFPNLAKFDDGVTIEVKTLAEALRRGEVVEVEQAV